MNQEIEVAKAEIAWTNARKSTRAVRKTLDLARMYGLPSSSSKVIAQLLSDCENAERGARVRLGAARARLREVAR